jgi:hypothetical protein
VFHRRRHGGEDDLHLSAKQIGEDGAFLAGTGPRAVVQNGGVDDTRASQRCLAGYL